MGLAAGGLGAAPVLAGMAGGAAAGAVNSAVNGGNLGTNVLIGAAFGGFAAGVGGPLAQSLGGGLQGAVGSGAILGAAYGGIGAAAAGKNVLTGMLAGAVSGALLAAAIYGGSKAWDEINSPALARNAEAATSGGRGFLGREVTNDPLIQGAISQYQSLTGNDLSGLSVYRGGWVAEGSYAVTLGARTMILNDILFSDAMDPATFYTTLGHEFEHVTQFRTVPFFRIRNAINNLWYGYYRNPYEYYAEQAGARFATHVLEQHVEPSGAYSLP